MGFKHHLIIIKYHFNIIVINPEHTGYVYAI